MEKISGSELIRAMAKDACKSMKSTKDIVEAIARQVLMLVAKGNEVVIPGLGKFYPKDRPERTGRNPQTGEAVQIPARRALAFKPLSVNKDLK